MMGILNLGSLILGLIAWILPLINLMRYEKHNHRKSVVFSISSLSSCAISLCFQIYYYYHLVKSEDWTALMDTTGATVTASIVLLIVTILLNTITLVAYHRKTAI
ncbi:cytochrome c oxidase subunit 4 [Bacillus niacini]|uniref:Cytochrome c oxidase subunit 4 n=1 Tax=Neobacillus niacini TaxID=86668 RepID=A0A852TIL8_9BACI|nr:cytochrome c oxidase subunit 4 [Neobacillus niacini]